MKDFLEMPSNLQPGMKLYVATDTKGQLKLSDKPLGSGCSKCVTGTCEAEALDDDLKSFDGIAEVQKQIEVEQKLIMGA